MEHFEALYPQNSRERELKELISYLRKGASAQVIGLPGVGRSNMLGFLPYNKTIRTHHLQELEKWYHFVYMDFSEVKNRAIADTIKFMLVTLSYSLQEREFDTESKKINDILKNTVDLHDELILFQSLKQAIDYLAIEKELTVLFIFDRFDQYVPRVNEQFFINLKILRDRAKYRFGAIFSVSRPLEEAVGPEILSTFYEFVVGNIVYLSVMDTPGLEFRIGYLEKTIGQKLDQKIKHAILELTGGHSKVTLRACENILSEPLQTSQGLEERLLKSQHVQSALYEIWLGLTPEEQETIQTPSAKSYEAFQKNGLFTEKGECVIPLFLSFIQKLPKEKTNLVYDEERNDILLGKRLLSEELSASEFRLLRFLMQNMGKVCEKDEIINAVWKDSATQEGVTDQALDQIVYRLRKKIEPNPNSPIFVITVKGQGYRFQKNTE